MKVTKRKAIKRLAAFLLATLLICSGLSMSVSAENVKANAETESAEAVMPAFAGTYSYEIAGISDAQMSSGTSFDAMNGVTLTVTDDGTGQPVTGHNYTVDIARVQKYIDGTEDTSYVWDKNPVLDTSTENVKYVVTYDVYDGNGQSVGAPATRAVRIPGALTYDIVTGGDKSVVLNGTADILTGVFAKVYSNTTWDVTDELGYSVSVTKIEKFNGSNPDTTYTWDGTTTQLDTSVVSTAYNVTYTLMQNGSAVLDNGNEVTESRKFTVISGNIIKPILDTDDEYITYTHVETSTGTEPFDKNGDGSENNSPGNDGSDTNNIVRSFDSYTYKVFVNSANYTNDTAYENGYINYRFVLPVTKDKAEFETSSMSWMSTDLIHYWKITEETIGGVACQVLTCSRYLTIAGSGAKNTLPCTDASANIVIRVKGMANGTVINTKGWAWMDNNDVDENNPNHVCADPNHKAAPNGGKEMVAFDLPAVTVSAAPKYNVTISEHQYKSCYGNFDFSTGNNYANNKGEGVVEGQLRGIGMYLSLRNDNPDKGFRGIELPDGNPITFDINLSAIYTNETNPSITATITPLVWTVDANKTSQDLGNKTTSTYDGRAMNIGGTKTSDTSLPYNKGTPSAALSYNSFCYNGGSWAAVQDAADPNVIHVTVKDYKINIDQFPDHNSGGTTTNMPTGAGVYWGAFSAGKLEYVIPNTTPGGQYIPTVYGNGTMKVTFYDVNLVAKSISNQETKTFLGREQTIYDESGKLTADDLRALNYPLRAGNGGFSQRIWYGKNIYADDFNGISNTTSGSCYQNGKDVGMPGQEGTIDWSVLWSANGSTENNLYAVDSLMLFDASAFEVRREPSVKSPNRDYGGNEFGSTGHMEYTFLYAAKPDGSNWTGIGEMNGTKIEDLVYYTSLNALLSDGKLCVGCLMQTRAKHYLDNASNSSSVTAALPVRIRTDESLLNNVYPTIVMSNIWWKSGTDKYTSEELKQTVVNDSNTSTGKNIPSITNISEYTKALNYASGKNYRYAGNTYKPSVYVEGNWTDGHVPSGNSNGDSLYVVPYITTIGKFIDQTVTENGVEKQKENFNLDYAQNVVDFRLEPALEVRHTTTTGGVTNVTVKETLPAGVSYNGDAVIGGVYVPNFSGGHGSMTDDGTLVDLNAGGIYKGITCKPVVTGTDSTGRVTLTFVFENVPYGCDATTYLGNIRYSGTINTMQAVHNQQFTSSASVSATWDHRQINVNNKNLASVGFKVSKLDSLSALKTVDTIYADNGEPIKYTININNTNQSTPSSEEIMMDTMPKPSSGSYELEDMSLALTKGTIYSQFRFFYTTDPKALTHFSSEYYLNGLADVSQFTGTTDKFGIAWTEKTDYSPLPKNTTAWCLAGSLPAGAILEAKIKIVPKDAEPRTAFTNNFSMGSVITNDTAYIVRRHLSGYTWLDDNKDGIMDAGEAALPGVTATLYKVTNGVVSSTPYVNHKKITCTKQTDKDGYYEFDNLEMGDYIVRFTSGTTVLETRYTLTNQVSDGSVDTVDTSKAALKETDKYGGYVKTAEISGISLPGTNDMTSSVFYWPNMNAGFYEPVFGHVSLPVGVEKTITAQGGAVTPLPVDFDFKITPLDSAPAPVKNNKAGTTAVITGEGTESFGDIEFIKPGIYKYEISEVNKTGQRGYENYTFDKNVSALTIEVGLDGAGNCVILSVTGGNKVNVGGTAIDGAVFDNTYTPEQAVIVFKGMKTIDGRKLADKEFTFTLTGKDDGVNETVGNGADGKIEFTEIRYTGTGVYHYTVKENATNKEGVTIDSKVYNITVTVTDSGKGSLTAKISGDTTTGADLNFKNTYKAPDTPTSHAEDSTAGPDKPKTGDNNLLLLWIILLLFSGSVILTTCLVSGKKSGKWR